jgi:predicted RNase H-like nuclease (RuvC/YqgF family)
MKDLKELFDAAEDGVLTYEQFMAALKEHDVKLVDLNEGNYVSKAKFESELEARAKEIEALNGTVSTRDTDLEALKKQLEEAGTDATKLSELTSQFETLKGKYDADTKSYKEQLKKQAYEFAVKEFASKQNFSSQAAKRDFIQTMIAKDLKMENDSILGADDFVKAYTENNADAFITAEDYGNDDYQDDSSSRPQFVSSTPGAEDLHTPDPTGGFLSAFHFTPVHPMPQD